jgi:hypothetical protein
MNYTITLPNNKNYNNSIHHDFFGGGDYYRQENNISENNSNIILTLKSFLLLNNNWDSYNAEKPSEIAITKAISFCLWLAQKNIDIFFTAPIADSDILVELKNGNSNLEFVFSSNTNDKILAWHEGDLSAEELLNDTTRESYLKWLICPNGNCPDL